MEREKKKKSGVSYLIVFVLFFWNRLHASSRADRLPGGAESDSEHAHLLGICQYLLQMDNVTVNVVLESPVLTL